MRARPAGVGSNHLGSAGAKPARRGSDSRLKLMKPQDSLQISGGFPLSHPMGEGWGEGSLSAALSGESSEKPPHPDPLPSEGRGNRPPSLYGSICSTI